jgi:hypothetical protein
MSEPPPGPLTWSDVAQRIGRRSNPGTEHLIPKDGDGSNGTTLEPLAQHSDELNLPGDTSATTHPVTTTLAERTWWMRTAYPPPGSCSSV